MAEASVTESSLHFDKDTLPDTAIVSAFSLDAARSLRTTGSLCETSPILASTRMSRVSVEAGGRSGSERHFHVTAEAITDAQLAR